MFPANFIPFGQQQIKRPCMATTICDDIKLPSRAEQSRAEQSRASHSSWIFITYSLGEMETIRKLSKIFQKLSEISKMYFLFFCFKGSIFYESFSIISPTSWKNLRLQDSLHVSVTTFPSSTQRPKIYVFCCKYNAQVNYNKCMYITLWSSNKIIFKLALLGSYNILQITHSK